MHGIDAGAVGQIVEEGIGRDFDGTIDIEPAVAPTFPVAELVTGARQLEEGAAEELAEGGDDPFVESHHRQQGLDGGGGRVATLADAVDQGARRIVEQGRVLLGTDTAHEHVGVIAG